MKNRFLKLALLATTVSALAACGGGSDDPEPTSLNSLVNVSFSTEASFNGAYGSGNTDLSDVDKVYNLSETTCVYAFSGLTKVGNSTSTMSGKISYREGASTLSRLEITVNGSVYAAGAVDDSTVDRNNNQIRVGSKTLASTAGDTRTFVVSAAVPMRPGRPSGC